MLQRKRPPFCMVCCRGFASKGDADDHVRRIHPFAWALGRHSEAWRSLFRRLR